MPSDLVLRFSKMYGLSMDWLITGEGAVQKPDSNPAGVARAAAEETAPYAKAGTRGIGQETGNRLEFAVLGPDETIYVGKLLNILRGKNASNASAIRYTIDAFLKSAGSTSGADQPGKQED
jgi:hypothetical protein